VKRMAAGIHGIHRRLTAALRVLGIEIKRTTL
jgi:hypothetical protein